MIRQQAFEGNEKMLKGCLHCHTTRSDGWGTPEETIRYYYEHDYDFLAITDHRNYNYKNYVPEIPLTIIPGMEYDNEIERDKGFRTFHTVCIGPEKEKGNGYEQDEHPAYPRAKDQYEYQACLDAIHAQGNLTIHCHPQWSGTPARYFEDLQGNFAMEIWNSAVALLHHVDEDAIYWDDLLVQGKKIYGVATDDDHWLKYRCRGWVMVRAENNIGAILEALQAGKFYSSCGPEIYDFYVENGKAVLKCSPVAEIRFQSALHPFDIRKPSGGEETITTAELDMTNHWAGGFKYIRASVVDREGKRAWTNPIFFE